MLRATHAKAGLSLCHKGRTAPNFAGAIASWASRAMASATLLEGNQDMAKPESWRFTPEAYRFVTSIDTRFQDLGSRSWRANYLLRPMLFFESFAMPLRRCSGMSSRNSTNQRRTRWRSSRPPFVSSQQSVTLQSQVLPLGGPGRLETS